MSVWAQTCDSLASPSQSAGITGRCHHTRQLPPFGAALPISVVSLSSISSSRAGLHLVPPTSFSQQLGHLYMILFLPEILLQKNIFNSYPSFTLTPEPSIQKVFPGSPLFFINAHSTMYFSFVTLSTVVILPLFV